ncbi:MAG: IS3 family transposase, partial [Mycoplasmatales bacterium]
MCSLLEVSRRYYYKVISIKKNLNEVDKIFIEYGIYNFELEEKIKKIYASSRNNYGCRKISKTLEMMGIIISPYKVLKITKKLNLISGYMIKKSKPYNKSLAKSDNYNNLLLQNFSVEHPDKTMTSDLTYIKVKTKFYYVCFIIDLFNREITSYSVSSRHDSKMVLDALNNSQINLSKLEIFHSDRGGEFKGEKLKKIFDLHNIKKSTSKAGCPFDNAVSESLFSIFKREWAKPKYDTEFQLEKDVIEFVHWYNYFRIHSTLNYKTPIQYKLETYEKFCLQKAWQS